MRTGRLKVHQALRALPELEELRALRAALIGLSAEDAELAATGAGGYALLDTRLVDVDALERRVPELADAVRLRAERLMRHELAALRAVEAGDWAGAARELVAAGELEEGERRFAAAEALYRKARDLGRKPRDRRAEGLAERRLGRVARLRGQLAQARSHYGRGREIAEAQRDVEGQVVACQGLGNLAVDCGAWAEARDWYERGLRLIETAPTSRLHWQLYNNLAVVELRSGNLDRAERWLAEATRIDVVMRDQPGREALENTRGRVLLARGRVDAAEQVFRGPLGRNPGPYTRCRLLVNLAETLLLRGRAAEAEVAAREAEGIAMQHHLLEPLVDAYRALGLVARRRGDAEAFLFFEQALDLCREGALPELELALTQHEYALGEADLGQLEAARARLAEALAIYRRVGSTPEIARAEADLRRLNGGPAPAANENHQPQER